MTRIIGCGNSDRGDDGAGVLVAEKLKACGIPAESCSGEATELIEAWREAENVIVVDAVATGAVAGTIHVWDAGSSTFSARHSASTHGFGVAEAIELSRQLGTLPPRLRVYGIEMRQCEPGKGLSLEVQEAVEKLVTRLIAEHSALPRKDQQAL